MKKMNITVLELIVEDLETSKADQWRMAAVQSQIEDAAKRWPDHPKVAELLARSRAAIAKGCR